MYFTSQLLVVFIAWKHAFCYIFQDWLLPFNLSRSFIKNWILNQKKYFLIRFLHKNYILLNVTYMILSIFTGQQIPIDFIEFKIFAHFYVLIFWWWISSFHELNGKYANKPRNKPEFVRKANFAAECRSFTWFGTPYLFPWCTEFCVLCFVERRWNFH